MKKLIILLAIAGFVTQADAQRLTKKHVPAAVKEAFSDAHPTVKDVDWSKDGSNYEVEFDVKKMDNSFTYDATGKLVETEIEILASDLPKGVLEYLKKNYHEDEVKESSKITDATGNVTFEAEVKGMDLLFDDRGSFIKSVKD